VLPGGLPGQTVAVSGSTSLALLVAAEASAPSGWVAWVEPGSSLAPRGQEPGSSLAPQGQEPIGLWPGRLGLLAAYELGLRWERLVMVTPPPGRKAWPAALAAALDAFEVVVACRSPSLSTGEARRLSAKARERRCVLVVAGGAGWPAAPDVHLQMLEGSWEGLGHGHGSLRARRAVVEACGRGQLSRPHRLALWLPAAGGGARRALPEAAGAEVAAS
jgi:hypothetical protein